MAKDRHRGAFVFGSIVGGAIGAVAALWKTPQSGVELRRKLGFESAAAHNVTAAARQISTSATGAAQMTKPLPGRALGLVEQMTAPLVGVRLGHTANNSQPGATGSNSTTVHRAAYVTENVTITEPGTSAVADVASVQGSDAMQSPDVGDTRLR